MKKTLLFLTAIVLLFSCAKQDELASSTPMQASTSFTARSGDDGHNEDDHDEHELCCRIRYGQWGNCINGIQVRSWTSNSPQCAPPIDSIQRSCGGAILSYFYYNTAYASIRVVCNVDGTINIYNATDQITASLPYSSGNRWINVSFLDPGTYTAKTQNVTIRFTK